MFYLYLFYDIENPTNNYSYIMGRLDMWNRIAIIL